jgi:hypothetical protein
MAKAVVEETVGMAKGHLEMLQELKQPVNGTPALKVAPATAH